MNIQEKGQKDFCSVNLQLLRCTLPGASINQAFFQTQFANFETFGLSHLIILLLAPILRSLCWPSSNCESCCELKVPPRALWAVFAGLRQGVNFAIKLLKNSRLPAIQKTSICCTSRNPYSFRAELCLHRRGTHHTLLLLPARATKPDMIEIGEGPNLFWVFLWLVNRNDQRVYYFLSKLQSHFSVPQICDNNAKSHFNNWPMCCGPFLKVRLLAQCRTQRTAISITFADRFSGHDKYYW